MVFVPASRTTSAAGVAGPVGAPARAHAAARPLAAVPWVREEGEWFHRRDAVTLPDAPHEPELVIRAVRPAGQPTAPVGWVIVDLPIDDAMLEPAVRAHRRQGRARRR